MAATREERQGVDRGQYLAPLLGIMMIMIDGYDLQSNGYVAPEIARAWSLDIAAFGMVFAAGLTGTIPGAMLGGPAARRVGPGAAVPIVLTSVAQNRPARYRTALLTATGCGQPIGAILGSALCARLIPTFGWKSAFVLGGVLPLLVLPGVQVLLGGRRPRDALASAPKAADRSGGRVRDLFSPEFRSTTLLIWAAAGLCVCFLYIIVNWLPGIVRGRGYSFESSVLMIGLFNTGTLIGALVFGALIDRFGPFKVLPA